MNFLLILVRRETVNVLKVLLLAKLYLALFVNVVFAIRGQIWKRHSVPVVRKKNIFGMFSFSRGNDGDLILSFIIICFTLG